MKCIFQVAQEDQKTFTDLVRQLVGRCGSDIEKARYATTVVIFSENRNYWTKFIWVEITQ